MSQAAKEKAGDYPSAIGHYSAAIHADRTDATFPLNRAAAYLKLGKTEDAERDCSTVLTLSKGNVKALFRRAQARVAMGKLSEAQKDLNEAAKLEPANQSVKQELTEVAELIQQAAKKSKIVPADVSPAPKRRRIPITIVEADGRRTTPASVDAPSASSAPKIAPTPAPKTSAEPNNLMNAVSSRPLNAGAPSTAPTSSITPAPVPPPTDSQPKSKPSSFKDAKSARDSSKPSRVGGGIFRASGDHTIFPTREAKPPPTTQESSAAKQEPKTGQVVAPPKQGLPPPPAPAPAPNSPAPAPVPAQPTAPKNAHTPATLLKSPMSLFDFTRAWEGTPAPTERFALLSRIPPDALPALFQTSLEPALFVEVVDVLGAAAGTGADTETAAAYMHTFPRVPRFGTVVRFLSAAEKARVRAVWGALGVDAGGAGLEDVWGAVYR
ncbi:hypothetical protein B0H17DRAFT_1070256 [Mycena rosella]|uniref:RNA polymerase II-associated protein 3 n=1 Tax=Mycena rosella TaxID=1033263 RepID=A0AAD7DBP1_MYCRO|nr:hypothetical protein B0H17DRAFT_1070256 [Mycena rosella]